MNSELTAIIAAGYSEGIVKFGDLKLDLSSYTNRIVSTIAKHLGSDPLPSQTIAFVRGLHCGDLYLATACTQHAPGSGEKYACNASTENASIAWKTFELTYKTYVRSLARYFYRAGNMAEDIADGILADLFLPDRSGVSRIASYDGRSSLSTWLRVIICNRTINMQRRSKSDRTQGTEPQAEVVDEPALASIEQTVRAGRYASALRDSLASACRKITPRERLILLWRYEHGLQLGQIARLLGIHQSNVTRQLERMQSKLRDHVMAALAARHRLSHSAIQECLEDLIENPIHSISILELIKNAAEHPPGDSAGRDVPTIPASGKSKS